MRTTVANLKGKTIAFAASGGLDSCTITRWLTEAGVNVVCITADMAQPDESDFDSVRQRMLACGAKELIVVPLHDAGAATIRSASSSSPTCSSRPSRSTPPGAMKRS